jgi:hypothetical protein
LEDPILSALLAAVICGAGSGLILRSIGSAGGIDILAIYLNKKVARPGSNALISKHRLPQGCQAQRSGLDGPGKRSAKHARHSECFLSRLGARHTTLHFPTDPQYERRQLEAVSKVLGELPATSKLQFMLTPKGSLDSHTPLEALAKGKVADVKIAAEGVMER